MSEFEAANGSIVKVVEDKRQAFGFAYVSNRSGTPAVDNSGENIRIGELEKAAYAFVKDARTAGVMHRKTGVGTLIEPMVFTPEKIEKMGLPEDFPQGWWIGIEYTDQEAWEGVKSGRYKGFSIHGKGTRHKIAKRERGPKMTELSSLITGVSLDEISLVDDPDDPEAMVLFWKRDKDSLSLRQEVDTM